MTGPRSTDAPPVAVDHAARPLALMREALALLDQAGAGIAAARLQHAIDTLDPPQPSVGPETQP